ncbi:pyruvate kinase [Stenotrophomonas maltophilia]|uniref:pyruvate kinase n=2 Tax=Gammaproteobacteria TaxID=1236 RepID=UPI0015DDA14E|nr:pyruvate kinase [Stenotrophomonas maltophilia]MBA0351362.1 pyruvate kinase [Stenotrophomonas maltophilia]
MFERQRRTKILATLGPATDPPGVLEDLFRAGVNVVRLNFSHGDPSGQAKRAAEVRAAAARVGVEVGILADLPGPKIRIERFAEGKVQLKAGNRFDLIASTSAGPGDATQVGVSYLGLPQDVGPGDVLLLDDGLMQLQVVEVQVQGERIINTVLNDGVLSDRKGLNKQGGGLSLGALTERDKELIGIVAKIGVDFIAVSFCRNAQDMNDARDIARSHGCDAALVSKIERTEAIENLEEIVEASDVVMVARGDLGVEIGDAELPGLQKKIIKASLAQNKVVITATQMLQSMVESPIPTRAEVLDVANSVIDGTDAVMLSAETAAGAWPVKAVEAMARICLGAERQFQTETDFNASPRNLERADQAIAMATMFLSQHVGVRAIVAMTESGGTARYLSRFRAKAPVFAVTRHDGARRQMALMRDVFPINFDSRGLTPREAARGSIRLLVEAELLQAGDRVVFTSGEHMETHGATNTLRLLEVGEDGRAIGLGDL